jgi:hypothetical protein
MKFQEFKENPWVRAGAKLMSNAGKDDDGGSSIPPAGGGPTPAQNFPIGPGPTPYTSGHVQAQIQFQQDLMNQYLSAGGGYYG